MQESKCRVMNIAKPNPASFSEISTQNSTLLKLLIALGSSKQELEKSSSSLNRD
jgi:hypothetical protein